MTRTTTPRPRSPKKPQPRSDYPQRWLEGYGRTLTSEEIRLVQARRGLTAAQQAHLNTYSAGLVVERASNGRVKAALRALLDSPALSAQTSDTRAL